MNVIHFGTDSEFVEISLPSSYSTEGWVQADIEIAVRCFHGRINPWVEAGDFERFTKSLRTLYETLKGEAEFSPLEKQFTLKFVGTTGGHIHVTGDAWSQATHENKLAFTFELDQSYLLAPLGELEDLVAQGAKNAA